MAPEPQHEALPSEEIRRRMIEKNQIAAELEARFKGTENRVREEVAASGAAIVATPSKKITADGRKLAGLASRAKKLESTAEALSERANAARAAADAARLDLTNYMAQNGLA